MKGEDHSAATKREWKVLGWIAGGLLFMAFVLIGLIAGGAFDPRPYGSPIQIDHPGIFRQLETGENLIAQPAPWLSTRSPARFSIRLTAAHAEGELDSGYGLAISDGSIQLVVGVSPLGYAVIREDTGTDRPTYPVPWQTWPHVQTGNEENEIWLDIAREGSMATISARLNREVLWQEQIDWLPDRAGLWLATFGGPTFVEFRSLEWFAEPEDHR